jgi:hypothetical protein
MRSVGCPTRAALKQITKLEHPARSHLVHNHFGLFDKLRVAALEREAEGSRHPGRVRGTSGIRSVLDDLPILFVSGLNGGPFLADAARAARLAGLNRCCRRCRVGERQTVPGSACASALRWSHVPACRTGSLPFRWRCRRDRWRSRHYRVGRTRALERRSAETTAMRRVSGRLAALSRRAPASSRAGAGDLVSAAPAFPQEAGAPVSRTPLNSVWLTRRHVACRVNRRPPSPRHRAHSDE